MEIIGEMEEIIYNMAKTLNYRITPQNSHNFIGRKIIYKSRNKIKCDIIKNVSFNGNTIYLKYNTDLNGNLQVVSRRVYLIDFD